ncbi:DUF6456 domain-containing protein [Mycoplana dimorpha]|uniref:DUF6456 domain-containing protein n=1 Tax=Mycoplana dimorpha TaxID=28320 RepID=A0A2T5BI99_MYCDI|nr:DUF6456 domain-containing protein [Mycoplana dimorpha]PTM98623.1 hypothetical protein C7449_101288 [Mycoplana dimorpha]
MNEPNCLPIPAARRPLAALLRFLVAAGGEVAVSGDDPVHLRCGQGRTAAVDRSTVAAAIRLGLAVQRGETLRAATQARNHLKRLLAGGDAFQDQHRDLAARSLDTGAGRQMVSINRLESPLAALARLKDKAGAAFLPEQAIAAGERLGRDFTRAGLQPRLTMAWEPRLASRAKGEMGQAREISDTAVAARLRLQAAIEAMGPELAGVALDVCCFMKGLEAVERERQWPVRSAKLMLRAALMALWRHYEPERPAARRRHVWGAEGYRPDMAARFGNGDSG